MDAESVPGVHRLGLGVQDIVHQGDLHHISATLTSPPQESLKYHSGPRENLSPSANLWEHPTVRELSTKSLPYLGPGGLLVK
jgi:hypothetical protein